MAMREEAMIVTIRRDVTELRFDSVCCGGLWEVYYYEHKESQRDFENDEYWRGDVGDRQWSWSRVSCRVGRMLRVMFFRSGKIREKSE